MPSKKIGKSLWFYLQHETDMQALESALDDNMASGISDQEKAQCSQVINLAYDQAQDLMEHLFNTAISDYLCDKSGRYRIKQQFDLKTTYDQDEWKIKRVRLFDGKNKKLRMEHLSFNMCLLDEPMFLTWYLWFEGSRAQAAGKARRLCKLLNIEYELTAENWRDWVGDVYQGKMKLNEEMTYDEIVSLVQAEFDKCLIKPYPEIAKLYEN